MLPFTQERLLVNGKDIFYYNRDCFIPEIYNYSNQINNDLGNYLGIEFEVKQRAKFSKAVDDEGKPGYYSLQKINRIMLLYDFYIDSVLKTTQLLYYEIIHNSDLYTFCSSIQGEIQKLFVPGGEVDNPQFHQITQEEKFQLMQQTNQTKKDSNAFMQNNKPIELKKVEEQKDQKEKKKKVVKQNIETQTYIVDKKDNSQQTEKKNKGKKQELQNEINNLHNEIIQKEQLLLKNNESSKQSEKLLKEEIQKIKDDHQLFIKEKQKELQQLKDQLEKETKQSKLKDLERQQQLKEEEIKNLKQQLENLQALYDSHYNDSNKTEEEHSNIIKNLQQKEKQNIIDAENLKQKLYDKDLQLLRLQNEINQINNNKIQMQNEIKSQIQQVTDQNQQQLNDNQQLINQYLNQIKDYQQKTFEKDIVIQNQKQRINNLENQIQELNQQQNNQNRQMGQYKNDVDQRINQLTIELDNYKLFDDQKNQQIFNLEQDLQNKNQQLNNVNLQLEEEISDWSKNISKEEKYLIYLMQEDEMLYNYMENDANDFIQQMEQYQNKDFLKINWRFIVQKTREYIRILKLDEKYHDEIQTQIDDLRNYNHNNYPNNNNQQLPQQLTQQQQQEIPIQPNLDDTIQNVFKTISKHQYNNKTTIYPNQLIDQLEQLAQLIPNHQEIQQYIQHLKQFYKNSIHKSHKNKRKDYRIYNQNIIQFLNNLGYQYQNQ
ncbi:hypothetical protein ABPG72_020130 [Tetrahymena utriculariae]